MARQATKTARLEVHLPLLGLETVKRAAEIQGRSVDDYVIATLQEAAQKTVRDTHIIELSLEDQRAFAEAIFNPPEPGPGLRKAREAHRRLIRESR